jgi:hypothetical protein
VRAIFAPVRSCALKTAPLQLFFTNAQRCHSCHAKIAFTRIPFVNAFYSLHVRARRKGRSQAARGGSFGVANVKQQEGAGMASKTVFVSDLSGKEIPSEREAVSITIKFGDARRGLYVVDAHPDDPEVKALLSKGRQQARRGRKPKAAA